MIAAPARPKAFAVWFKDLDRWSVSSFFKIGWKWPAEVIRPLSAALERRYAPVDRAKVEFANLKLVTLHFGGDMQPRDLKGKVNFKGKLFNGFAGDVVYSKIDVRNGAIGVVPTSMPTVAVSSEYPVYRVRPDVALPEYVKLLFRTRAFRQQINSMISGASGRKRVQPSDLEEIEVPLPPLPVQRAIVRRWGKAQEEAAAVKDRLARLEAEIPLAIYKALGTPTPKTDEPLPKMILVWWKDLERWSFNYLARARRGLLGFAKSKFPVRTLGDSLLDTMNGFCIKPVADPTPHKMLKLSALSPAGLDLAQTKFVKVSERTAGHFSLRRGDLLICRSVGSYDLVAKCAVAQEDRPDVLFPDIIIRARFNNAMLPEFAREIIQTPLGRSYFQSNARTAVGMWKIGAEDIQDFPIPLAPLDVQRRIVGMVSKRRAEIAAARQAAAKKSAEIAQEVEDMILGKRAVPGAKV
jgi:type I restriction enzyme S subunit